MKSFFKTVAIVTVFSICEKCLGFLYRIFLSDKIGAEGIGLYQVTLSIFSLILTVCCSGTPVTVSRLITKYHSQKEFQKEKKVISAGILFTFFTALPVCIILLFSRKILAFVFADERCIKLFYILLPGLIFTSVYSVLRGVFWGRKDFLPYSVIELLEESVMIIFGILLINGITDIYQGTTYAVIAVVVSFAFSFTLALTVFFLRKNKIVNPKGEILPLLKASAPITAMRTASSITSSLVSIILPMRLVAVGYTSAETMSMFGQAAGQAIPILFIPSALIGSFTLVLIPIISENFYKNENIKLKENIENAIRFSVFLSCLFFPVFFVCGDEIGVLIFGNERCGEYLTASAYLIFFIGISNITTSILNSIGKENKTLLYYGISAVFMLLAIWFLPKFIGIYALLIGFTSVFGLTSVFNILLIKRTCTAKPQIEIFLCKTLLIQIPCVFFGLMLKKLLLPNVGSVIFIIICTLLLLIFNGLLFFGFGLIDLKDVATYFPKLKKKKTV